MEESSEVAAAMTMTTTTDAVMATTKLERYNTWIFTSKVALFEGLENNFVAKHGDVVLASVMKTGTTWMKALLHSLMACVHSFPNLLDQHNPHDIVPNIDIRPATWTHMPSPRLLTIHMPFHSLPSEITQISDVQNPSGNNVVKIVYITRNPRDTFLSFLKFRDRFAESAPQRGLAKDVSEEAVFKAYCAGNFHGGPFAENVLGYLRESRRRPEKVMVVRYEDLQADCEAMICKIGDFLGYPSDVVKNNASFIARRCSFENLTSLVVNNESTSVDGDRPSNDSYFRKGKTGDWRDHFTPEMEERIHKEIELKLEEEGVYFNYNS